MAALSIPSVVKSIAGALGPDDKFAQKAKSKSEDFESVFLTQFLNSMTEGLGQDPALEEEGFSGGSAERQWKTYQNEFLARNIAKQGGIGLSQDIYNAILKSQGA